MSRRDVSTIQQFEALHLSEERGRGPLRGGIVRGLLGNECVSVWVCAGRGLLEHFNVFILMSLSGQLSAPC